MEAFERTDDDQGDEGLIDVLLGLRAMLGRGAAVVGSIAASADRIPSEDAPEELVLFLTGLVALERAYRTRLDTICVAATAVAPPRSPPLEGTLLR